MSPLFHSSGLSGHILTASFTVVSSSHAFLLMFPLFSLMTWLYLIYFFFSVNSQGLSYDFLFHTYKQPPPRQSDISSGTQKLYNNKNDFFFLNFTISYWFCQILKWIRHRYTSVPHPEPSFLLPPHTIPLGRPSTPAPSIQYRTSNLDWQLVSYMIFYMFQCHSPKSSHPLPLPQSP